MKLKNLALIALASAALTSCTVAIPYSGYSYLDKETQNIATPQVYGTPQIAELNVSETRITYTERLNVRVNDYKYADLNTIAMTEKDHILENAIRQNNCDVLVQPKVDIKNDNDGFLVITITGYPANYKNFRNLTEGDKWLLDLDKNSNDNKSPLKIIK